AVGNITVAVATDTRPTGGAVASCVVRALLAENASVCYLGTAPTPEALAYAACEPAVDGLIYITASHNPLGHNGLKFSAGSGGVLPGGDSEEVKKLCLEIFNSPENISDLASGMAAVTQETLSGVLVGVAETKEASLAAYRQTVDRVAAAGAEPAVAAKVLGRLRDCIKKQPLGVLAELNGSARTCSLDENYLHSLGVRVHVVAGEPGMVEHAILPEGDALLPACRALEKEAARDKSFDLGYVPDNDGDRGNVVVLDSRRSQARPLEAQEVFALAVAAELSFVTAQGLVKYDSNQVPDPPLAVVVNGPTSGRVQRLAECFGARVFRAEVGEANVIELARQKQQEGCLVPIVGEGSNGGNITHPGQVRDPLSTVLGLIKLLRLDGVLDTFRTRLAPVARRELPGELVCLEELARMLPVYSSTGGYEKRSLVQIKTSDHNALKTRYEEIFQQRWSNLAPEFARRLAVTDYSFVNYQGVQEIKGPGGRSGDGRGGFKVLLTDRDGREKGFLWMRGSRTEPVFRVMADVAAGPEQERYLLEIHREILREADR
ncbi:phosphatidylglycerol lysyltransferase, partial [Gemmatimonadota bacterium]